MRPTRVTKDYLKPPLVLFLTISPNPERLLPTIRSRCQKLRLQPLSISSILDWLSKIHEIQNRQILVSPVSLRRAVLAVQRNY